MNNNSTQLKPTPLRRQVLELAKSGAINTQPYQYQVRKTLGELKKAGLVGQRQPGDNKSWFATIDGKLVLLRWASSR